MEFRAREECAEILRFANDSRIVHMRNIYIHITIYHQQFPYWIPAKSIKLSSSPRRIFSEVMTTSIFHHLRLSLSRNQCLLELKLFMVSSVKKNSCWRINDLSCTDPSYITMLKSVCLEKRIMLSPRYPEIYKLQWTYTAHTSLLNSLNQCDISEMGAAIRIGPRGGSWFISVLIKPMVWINLLGIEIKHVPVTINWTVIENRVTQLTRNLAHRLREMVHYWHSCTTAKLHPLLAQCSVVAHSWTAGSEDFVRTFHRGTQPPTI
jgi:hypothetical protein